MNKINIMKIKDISETIEFIKQGNLKKFDYNDLVNVIPTFGLNDEILHEQPISLQSFYGKGIKIWQYPNQFARLIMWLNDIRVNSYVEIGCRWGGTFIIISQILKLNNDNIKLYACDFIDQSEILREYSQHVNFNYLQINSRCEEFINSVRNNCDMVFIDGDHTYEGCKYDFDLFKDNINTKYIIFHDIDNVSCPGVSKIWNEIKVDDRFEFIEFIEQSV